MNRLFLAALVVGATGCASPLHLTYDYGRAYTQAVTTQADLTRSSVSASQYELYGTEAAAIRINVETDSTNAETAETTLTTSASGN